MAFIAHKRHRGPGRFLQWKIWLFSLGAILLLVGMARAIDLLVGAAIAVLAVAFVLRFFERDEDDDAADDEDYEDEKEPADGETAPAHEAVDDPANGTGRRRPIG